MSAKSSDRAQKHLVWMLVHVAALSVGCFSNPNDQVARMVCNTNDNCPVGYDCKVPGVAGGCRRPGEVVGIDSGLLGSGGSGGLDGASNGGAGGPVDVGPGGAVDSGAGVSKDGSFADAPLAPADTAGMDAGGASVDGGGSKNGATCTANSDCPSGYCVDGLCCESACKGTCYSCAQLYTGKPDGTCASVGAGKKDPAASCVDQTATNQCGSDGTCDGAGACRKVGTDHVCATASCNSSTFTPTSTCDGKGACNVVTSQDCGSSTCDAVDGCRTVCATDKDCPTTSYCNATTKRCAAKKIAGDACTLASECTSGYCADGVCCNTDCSGKCMACSGSLTTQRSGICSAVKVGTDPHDSCAVDTTNQCGADGTCDGAGACRMTGSDHVCATASCNAGIFTHAAACDGKGICATATSESCGAFTCSAVNGCQKSCAADTDCTGQSYCDTGTKTCTTKKDNGAVCTAAAQCTSSNCVDGMCCNGKCDGLCSSCKKAHTNVADGTCASVNAGLDPYNSCQDESATNKCGNTGMCDGTGACQKSNKTQTCGTAACSGNLYTPASMCDGLGTCKAGSQTNCGNFQCSPATGCLTICTTNSDCSSATYCDLSLAKPVCSPKLGPGSACGTDANKCGTGRCVDGVCCNTDCTTSCYACNVTGNAGTCSPVTSGTVDPKAVCKAAGTTCGQNGTCAANGICYVATVGTTGADCTTKCSGATLTINSCDGKGSCMGTSAACSNNLICAASGTACKNNCTGDSDCTGGMVCAADGTNRCAPICLFDDPSSLSDDICVLGP
jgi:hypothetical protein